MSLSPSRVLIVDDNEDNRIVLARRLTKDGLEVRAAENGIQALEMLQQDPYDLVLLDIMMPEMNGYQVLEHLKEDSALRHLPVIIISAVDEFESVVRCIELGAEDYLMKPFNRVMLRARIGASLEKKRLRDNERAILELLQQEQEKSEQLLLSIFPEAVAERLKEDQGTIADSYSDVTVLFADIVDFTKHTATMQPVAIVDLLSEIFTRFDQLTEKYGLEKIKTVGDAYMAVSGLPMPMSNHIEAAAEMALELRDEIKRYKTPTGEPYRMRLGLHCGPVVAGVIGTKKFIYDLWGDTVNIASRMESHGKADHIQTSEAVYGRLVGRFQFEARGVIPIKGIGEMPTYFLSRRQNQS